jgi:hypothetical protein
MFIRMALIPRASRGQGVERPTAKDRGVQFSFSWSLALAHHRHGSLPVTLTVGHVHCRRTITLDVYRVLVDCALPLRNYTCLLALRFFPTLIPVTPFCWYKPKLVCSKRSVDKSMHHAPDPVRYLVLTAACQ